MIESKKGKRWPARAEKDFEDMEMPGGEFVDF
jgi:hypothetical protein